ncbi:hypothetical protein [Gracilibacillus sp. YIM 98692]|uniref:hypothetical protein n=1 Tax=Gracilibacillus sp. YIM 98692 TaxID=2663532 RepID=UPI0013D1DF46|nr:hypothetical protein [Gracilibacillus sp. YIM 98692]
MTQLKEVLIKVQKDKILLKALGDRYHTATEEEKEQLLDVVRDQIDHDVEKLLNDHINHHNKTKPARKKYIGAKIVSASLNIISTIGIGYSVNQELWVPVIICGAVLLVSQVILFIFE